MIRKRETVRTVFALEFALMFWGMAVVGGTLGWAAETDISSLQDQADRAYNEGDCGRAIRSYSHLIAQSQTSSDLRNVAYFRRGYCELNSGNAEGAKRDFQKFLSQQPSNEEARLKLAEANLMGKDYGSAIAEAQKVKMSPNRESAVIIAARALLEDGNFQGALQKLDELNASREIGYLVSYWKGVAQYRSGSTSLAKSSFEQAMKTAPSDSWVKPVSQDWLDQIGKDLRIVRGQASFGYLVDTNVGQSGTQSLSQYGVIVAPNSSADPGTSIHDAAWWVAAELGVLPYTSDSFSVNTLFNFSSPYYFNDHAYNLQSYSGDIAFTYTENPELVPSFDVRYLDTRYNTVYYQDYLIATPQLSWQPAPLWYVRLSAPYTQYVKSRHDHIIAPAASARRILNPWLSVTGGLLYSIASGPSATYYNSSSTYVTDGVAFSNYTSFSQYITGSAYLPLDISFNATIAHYHTAYAHENVPSAAMSGTVGDRSDTLWQVTLDASRPVIAQRWIIDASWTYSTNSSNGYQGVPSGTSMYNYNYNRNYFLLNNTVTF